MKYFVIGDEDTVLGFSLVGVEGISVLTASEATSAFNKALENKENGIIIITDKSADLIRDLVDQYLFSETFPLIVEIPASGGKYKNDLRSMANKAIGVAL